MTSLSPFSALRTPHAPALIKKDSNKPSDFKTVMTMMNNRTTSTPSSGSANFDMGNGGQKLNIDAYFNASVDNKSLNVPPLLLPPSLNNVNALSTHISSAMPQFLQDNHIPVAPASMNYDSQGQIELPSDYQHAEAFKQALKGNPTMERMLQTANALSSHYAGMQRAAASSASHDPNHQYSIISMQFSANGQFSITADGKAISSKLV
jgi:hypothetical protein